MKNFKAAFTLLLAGTLFLASCTVVTRTDSDDDDDDKGGKEKETTAAASEAGTDSISIMGWEDTYQYEQGGPNNPAIERPYPGSETTGAVEEETTAAPLPAQKEEPASVNYSKGSISRSGVYTSDWLELKFVPSGNVTVLTEEEIAAAYELGSEMVGTEDYDAVSLYEMMAADYTTGDSVNIVTEKLTITSISEEVYLIAAKRQFTNMGIEPLNLKEYTKLIAGKEYRVLDYDVNIAGMQYRIVQCVRKIGDRMAIISVSDFSGNGEALFNCFSAY